MELVRELYGGEVYEYYPLGEHVVVASGVCGGRPTFKYTRLEVTAALAMLARGASIADVIREYSASRLSPAAVAEALRLAGAALADSARMLPQAV